MALDSGILDQVTQQFIDGLKSDAHHIQTAAQGLFLRLAFIQLTASALWLALTGESFQRLFIRLLQLSLSFGVLYACIHSGSQWIPAIINGFIELGQTSGVQSLDPSSIVDQGLSLSGAILQGFFNWGLLGHPFVSLVGGIVCIAIVILYGLLAAELTIVLVKSYVLVSLSSLFFAFGATEPTRLMTIHYVKTVIGIGLQLMTLYFLMGVGQHIGEHWSLMTREAAEHHQLMPMLVILTSVIVYYMVVRNVPSFIANLAGVGGFQHYGASSASLALQAGMMGSAQFQSGKALGASLVQGGGQFTQAMHSTWKAGRAAPVHVAASAFQSVKEGVMQSNTHKTFGQRFNQHLANRVRRKT